MPRAPFQVLVFPFKQRENVPKYALFRRRDAGYWQGIAGGGEDGESPENAALRETNEEAGISGISLISLQTEARVPVSYFKARSYWPKNLYVIPEHYFAFECKKKISLSSEHTEVKWFDYKEAIAKLHWHNNQTGLWELNERIVHGNLSLK